MDGKEIICFVLVIVIVVATVFALGFVLPTTTKSTFCGCTGMNTKTMLPMTAWNGADTRYSVSDKMMSEMKDMNGMAMPMMKDMTGMTGMNMPMMKDMSGMTGMNMPMPMPMMKDMTGMNMPMMKDMTMQGMSNMANIKNTKEKMESTGYGKLSTAYDPKVRGTDVAPQMANRGYAYPIMFATDTFSDTSTPLTINSPKMVVPLESVGASVPPGSVSEDVVMYPLNKGYRRVGHDTVPGTSVRYGTYYNYYDPDMKVGVM